MTKSVRPRDVGIGLLFQRIREAVIVADLETGRIVLWNPGAEKLFGYSAAEAINLPVETIVPQRLRDRHRAGFARYHATRHGAFVDTGTPMEVAALRKTGEEVTVELTLGPLGDMPAGSRYVLGVIRDVTERKRAEEEHLRLAREQAARADAEAFLASVAHDLKGPLASIKMLAQLLLRRAQGPDAAAGAWLVEGLSDIDRAASRMATMLTDLLDTTRLRMGGALELDRQPTDLIELARRVARDYQQTTERHEVRVDSALDTLAGTWDAARLERVLGNLLSNAITYSPAGGAITLTVTCEDVEAQPWAILRVRDDGIGIPAAELPRIFEPFYRGSNVAGKIAGTGIGLAGARQIVEQHGGSLTVASREGAGSTFTVCLPLSADESPQAQREP